MELIKSVGYDQQEIINNILKLYNKGKPIDFDPCYNKGGFYRNGVVQEPEIKGDIKPLLQGVEKMDVTKLPFENKFNCIIFDPPFLAGGGQTGKISQRFGSFRNVDEMKSFLKDALSELHCALKNRGILIVKCQDIVNGRRNYMIHNDILNLAGDKYFEFEILDLFVLLAKSRPTKLKNQQHARKFHSYFIVLKKKKEPSKYILPPKSSFIVDEAMANFDYNFSPRAILD